MDASYPAPHAFHPIDQASWPEAVKDSFVENGARHSIGIPSSAHSGPASNASVMMDGRPSNLKVEDEINAQADPAWHNTMTDVYHQPRHFSQPHLMGAHGPQMARMAKSAMITIPPNHAWPTTQSGSSTPTPIYGPAEGFGGQMGYDSMPANYAFQHEQTSAIPMSPQSSQGGWASATSSDGIEQRGMMQSPIYRPPSPSLVVRSDGIRKKNARFEIPKDRNLSNIDAMIHQTTDENEKKELKQQKRLLRNRQAALDSRQRKKTHTEKLEQEKKVSEKKMFDMEEALARLDNNLTIEREQWLQQRQQMEQYIHALTCERDEAIRTKTVETSELRGQIILLKDCVEELERQQHRTFTEPSDTTSFTNGFDDYRLQDQYDEEFSFITSDDLHMDDADHAQRQATPKPSTLPSNLDKLDGFTWNTFYMCLLVGAMLAAHGKTNTPTNSTTSAIASSISPAEAGNVLKAVLKRSDTDVLPAVMANSGDNGMVQSSISAPTTTTNLPASTLESLHQTLSKPSRRQELEAAFSLSASSYNHIMDPFNNHLNAQPDHEMVSAPKPSQLQKAYASMRAQTDEMERATGIGAKLRERSALWDQVPAQVVRNFHDLVRSSAAMSENEHVENIDR